MLRKMLNKLKTEVILPEMSVLTLPFTISLTVTKQQTSVLSKIKARLLLFVFRDSSVVVPHRTICLEVKKCV
jgi:hypothetical protein